MVTDAVKEEIYQLGIAMGKANVQPKTISDAVIAAVQGDNTCKSLMETWQSSSEANKQAALTAIENHLSS